MPQTARAVRRRPIRRATPYRRRNYEPEELASALVVILSMLLAIGIGLYVTWHMSAG